MKKLFACVLIAALLYGCAPAPVHEIEITPLPPQSGPTPNIVQPSPDDSSLPAGAAAVTPDITPVPPPATDAVPTPKPTEKPTAEPSQTPEDTPDAPVEGQPLLGIVIGVDPGHQRKANRDKEPVAPGSDEVKNKVSSGTRGIATEIPEYEVNLAVGLLLRDMLKSAGATVVMVRETNDIDISNAERAVLFNREKTDYAIRLHCNGSDDHDKRGAFMLVPAENPFKADCERAAQLVIDEYCAVTGLNNRGLTVRSDQTGFNWCERMVINIEMGHMTNADEDRLLTDADFQVKMARGIFNGILKFYE